MPGVLRPSWDARALSAGGCCMQGEVLVPGASNMVATAEDCCQACWMYSGQPGRGNSTAAGRHAFPLTDYPAISQDSLCSSPPALAGISPYEDSPTMDSAGAVSIMCAQTWREGTLTLCSRHRKCHGGTGDGGRGRDGPARVQCVELLHLAHRLQHLHQQHTGAAGERTPSAHVTALTGMMSFVVQYSKVQA